MHNILIIVWIITCSLSCLIGFYFSIKLAKQNRELLLENMQLKNERKKLFNQEQLNQIIASRLSGY